MARPDGLVRGTGATMDKAKAVCAGCLVRQECLEAALGDSGAAGDVVGDYGGGAPGDRAVGGLTMAPLRPLAPSTWR